MKIFMFSTLLVLVKVASTITIECVFKNLEKDPDSTRTYSTADVYSCEVQELETTEHENYITVIEGTHLPGMSNENVTHFKVADQKVEYFPGGLEQFFPNLETVTIQRSLMKFIFKTDLMGLSKLKFLALGNNQIELLGPGLLEANTLLEEIHFENNKLSKISEDLLDPLTAFPKVIHFFNNTCIKEDLKTPEAKSFKDLVKKNCELSKNDLIESGDRQVRKLSAKIEILETISADSSLLVEPVIENDASEADAETMKLTNEIKILETNVSVVLGELERKALEVELLREDNVELEAARKRLTKNLTETLSEMTNIENTLQELENSYEAVKLQLLNKTTTEDVIVMVMAKLAAKLTNYQEDNADLDKRYEEKLKEKTLMIQKVEAERDRILEEKKVAEKKIKSLESYNKELNRLATQKIANLAFQHKTKH